jgi:Mn2+/Fe2+ NRAMP family transporter
MGDLCLGNFLTLVTEFIGVRAGLSFFGIPPVVSVAGALVIVMAAVLSSRYWTWERLTLGFAVFNLLFIPAAFLAHPDWGAVARSFATWGPLPKGGLTSGTLLILVADIGATVTPWMLFFQQSAVVDKGLTPHDIPHGRFDTFLGALLATLAAAATIIAASPLFVHHIDASKLGQAQYAQALQPYLGHVGAALFALGLFEAGLVAAITISTSSAYAFGEVAAHAHSLNRSVREGRLFYAVLIGMAAVAAALVLIPHAPLVFIVLIVNVIAVLAMPPALLFLYLLCNDREIMGNFVSSRIGNLITGAVVVLLAGAGLFFAVTVIFPNLLPSG